MLNKKNILSDILNTLLAASIVPGILYLLYCLDIILWGTLKVSVAIFVLIFFVGPLVFKFSYTLQKQAIFLNYVNLPINPQYENPEEYGLNGTRNFYITSSDGVRLGAWHILPEELVRNDSNSSYFENALAEATHPVFIYMHGNSGNRAAGHRIELYHVLRERYHVIAFDYRSYGDSSVRELTETGVVEDAVTVVDWVHNITSARVFVWGHSLGTGISTHALHLLALRGVDVSGLVLESPFNNMRSEVTEHPSSMLFKNLPWFKYTVVDALYNSGLRFESDEHVKYINCPILILHAEDDLIVPFKLGSKLYSTALNHRTKEQGPVYFEKFQKELGYGHKYICRAPSLPAIIWNFVDNHMN